MRDPSRITPILTLVERIWRANPDLRLLQLLLTPLDGISDHHLYNVEDDHLFRALRDLYEREVGVDSPGKV